MISAHRRAVIVVSDTMPFAYTIGNSQHGLPELLVLGVASDARPLLNHVSILLRGQSDIADGRLVPLGDKALPVKLVDIGAFARRSYAVEVERYYGEGHDYRLMQVVLPDPMGKYPGDAGCLEPHASVPVLI